MPSLLHVPSKAACRVRAHAVEAALFRTKRALSYTVVALIHTGSAPLSFESSHLSTKCALRHT